LCPSISFDIVSVASEKAIGICPLALCVLMPNDVAN
jgi:hypothetical protein